MFTLHNVWQPLTATFFFLLPVLSFLWTDNSFPFCLEANLDLLRLSCVLCLSNLYVSINMQRDWWLCSHRKSLHTRSNIQWLHFTSFFPLFLADICLYWLWPPTFLIYKRISAKGECLHFKACRHSSSVTSAPAFLIINESSLNHGLIEADRRASIQATCWRLNFHRWRHGPNTGWLSVGTSSTTTLPSLWRPPRESM